MSQNSSLTGIFDDRHKHLIRQMINAADHSSYLVHLWRKGHLRAGSLCEIDLPARLPRNMVSRHCCTIVRGHITHTCVQSVMSSKGPSRVYIFDLSCPPRAPHTQTCPICHDRRGHLAAVVLGSTPAPYLTPLETILCLSTCLYMLRIRF
jgi:hypothetical protein